MYRLFSLDNAFNNDMCYISSSYSIITERRFLFEFKSTAKGDLRLNITKLFEKKEFANDKQTW